MINLSLPRIAQIVFFSSLVIGVPVAVAEDPPPPDDPRPPSRDEVIALVERALPSLISEDNSGLVKSLLAARLGKPVSENLNVVGSLRDARVFGPRSRPSFDEECSRGFTESGDPSPDPCYARLGEQAGKGAYREFSWSKHLGHGDVKFLRRDADGTVEPSDLKPVSLSDEAAYQTAMAFVVELMGVPPEELISPDELPDGASLPVRSLAIGSVNEKGEKSSVEAYKMVQLPRALKVDLVDPASGRALPRVPATGEAFVLMNDAGVWQAGVRRWRALSPEQVDPAQAKTRSELVNEIADAILTNESYSPIDFLGVKIGLMAGDPTPTQDGIVYPMLPAVEISAAVVPKDLSEEEQNRLGPNTAGFTQEFPLVALTEVSSAPETD
ncbi:MAG: hypothetical protein VX663_07715 [Pseudomonadota bacterium]|nr:hypothetical protein [Pseudomonadota bacterium]